MFSSIVVPLDLEPHGDRALPMARRLAATAGIPLELVTVSSPALDEELDRYELDRRGRATDIPWTATILHDNDPAAAIIGFVVARPRALVVMATRARSAIGGLVLGSVSEGLLKPSGPPVPAHRHPMPAPEAAPPASTPVAGLEVGPRADAIGAALDAWSASFDGPPPQLADVSDDVDAVDALMELADRVDNPVIVVASSRWTDPERTHLRSVARRLAHDAHHPVLVVPAARVPAAAS